MLLVRVISRRNIDSHRTESAELPHLAKVDLPLKTNKTVANIAMVASAELFDG